MLDADAGTARWISGDATPPDWTRRYATTAVSTGPDAAPLPYRARPRWSGPAVAAPLPAPQLTVRGVDREHNFEHEPRPSRDMDPAFLELHRKIADRNAQILYRGTEVKSYDDRKALPDDRAA